MIIVFKRYGKYPVRVIPNVVDIRDDGDYFQWKIGRHTNSWRKGIALTDMESRFVVVYALCGDDDCARMGVGDGLIKWLVWGNEWIADLLSHQAQRYVKKNPIQVNTGPLQMTISP